MANHVTQWLGAYHDGELSGLRLHQVEQHLVDCAECQAELEEMQGFSTLLRDTAPDGDFLPAERFVANLTLSLPRHPEHTQPRSMLEIGWWLIPIGLLGVWLFMQITISLSDIALFIANSGLFNGELAWLKGNPLQMEWFATTMNLFGSQIGAPGREFLSVLNNADLFVRQVAGSLLPQALIAVLYLGWLVSWWLRRQGSSSQNTGSFSQS